MYKRFPEDELVRHNDDITAAASGMQMSSGLNTH